MNLGEAVNAGRSSVVLKRSDLVNDFDAEFERLWGRTYAVAYVLVGNRGDAEDIAQETLARALVRWQQIWQYAEAWVVRVAGNLAIDMFRERSRKRGLPTDDVSAPNGERVDLQRALFALSPRQREVVVMRYIADLPEAEVANTLRCSVGTVKTHAARGLAALRRSLGAAQ